MAAPNFDDAIEQYHCANSDFVRGNRKPLQQMFSHRDDVSLLNPAGDTVVGWSHVFNAQERAMARFSEGEATDFETLVRYVTPALAVLVEIERRTMRLSGEQMVPRALRATTVFRLEDGSWKIVHRHADLLADSGAPSSIAQQER